MLFYYDIWLQWSGDNDDDTDKAVMYEARVDIKKLSHVLTGHFSPIKVICSKLIVFVCTNSSYYFLDIVDGCGLQFFLLDQDVSLQYYIPAISWF